MVNYSMVTLIFIYTLTHVLYFSVYKIIENRVNKKTSLNIRANLQHVTQTFFDKNPQMIEKTQKLFLELIFYFIEYIKLFLALNDLFLIKKIKYFLNA